MEGIVGNLPHVEAHENNLLDKTTCLIRLSVMVCLIQMICAIRAIAKAPQCSVHREQIVAGSPGVMIEPSEYPLGSS